MDVGEEITVDLMAKLIKFQLLTIKNNDIARRAAEQKVRDFYKFTAYVMNSNQIYYAHISNMSLMNSNTDYVY